MQEKKASFCSRLSWAMINNATLKTYLTFEKSFYLLKWQFTNCDDMKKLSIILQNSQVFALTFSFFSNLIFTLFSLKLLFDCLVFLIPSPFAFKKFWWDFYGFHWNGIWDVKLKLPIPKMLLWVLKQTSWGKNTMPIKCMLKSAEMNNELVMTVQQMSTVTDN